MQTKLKKDLYIPFRWEERRHAFLERFFYLPKKYDSAQHGERLPWSHPLIFGNASPVCVEFCSGNGQWIIEQAKADPTHNWVAVERRFERARQIWLKSHREELPNLYVACAEALEFLRYYVQPKSIAKCFVNFPDPWPKRHHAKHRLVQAPFLEALQKTLEKDAPVTLATDSAAYRDQMIEVFNAWPTPFPAPYFRTDLPDYGESFFADLWLGKGREIYYLRYANGVD